MPAPSSGGAGTGAAATSTSVALPAPARRGVKSYKSDDLGAFFNKDAASRIISSRAPLAQPGTGAGAGGGGAAPPSPQQVLPRRGAVGRRASTGMYGASAMLANGGRDWRNSNNGGADRKGTATAASSSLDGNDATSAGAGAGAAAETGGGGPRKEYTLDRSDKVHLLKDRLSQAAPSKIGNASSAAAAACAPPKRAKRRSSLSSEASEYSMDVEHLYSSDHSSSVLLPPQYHNVPPSPHRSSRRSSTNNNNNSSAFNMSNVSEDTFAVNNTTKGLLNNGNSRAMAASHNNSLSSSSTNNSSSVEARRQQAAAKTDQIVESLVWFSFHTPRAVLEDLISNELDLYRAEQKKAKKKKAAAAATTTAANKKKKAAAKGKKATAKNDSNNANKAKDYKMSYVRMDDDDDDDDDDDNDNEENPGEVEVENDNGSHEDMSDDMRALQQQTHDVFDGDFSMSMKRLATATNGNKMMAVPKSVPRQSALLFVDMSGFTRLSTILDVESLSKVINSYFDMIVSEVIQYGGDILKFAGDAFFAEWKVQEDDADDDGDNDDLDDANGGALGSRNGKVKRKKKKNKNALAELNASLASITDLDFDGSVPRLSLCVLSAARCGASIVKKFSDYHVTSSAAKGGGGGNTTTEAMLNVHCGVGVGSLIGLHVGDFREDPQQQQEDEHAVELRREFLVLGDPIEQVSRAADVAKDGEVLASPEAIRALGFCCKLSDAHRDSTDPILIASRNQVFFGILEPRGAGDVSTGLQPYESLRMHCKALDHTALARLHLQMALYVHPVIRGDELGVSAAIQAGTISRPREELERRHRAEAELRSVLTIFIKAIISPRVTGMDAVDGDLYRKLCDIMHVTSRELDRYSGHLRQFIVDDKGTGGSAAVAAKF
jgi:class 3 adenylate cyclase